MNGAGEAMRGEVLIVDDVPENLAVIHDTLVQGGYRVRIATSGLGALESARRMPPDLILLDWMMPGVSGIEFTRELKGTAMTRDIPVIMVTARAEEEDTVRGLNVGCDDYISKPFSFPELTARIQAVLRRTLPGGEEEQLAIAGLQVDAASQRVTARGEPVRLGPTEYRLLHFFVSHPERVYTREQVLDRVWGQNVYVEERTVDVHIRRLRKALAPHGYDAMIQTVRGTGYRFSEKV